MSFGDGIVRALIILLAGYLASGVLAGAFTILKAYRTPEDVMRAQAPTLSRLADEKGVSTRQLAVRYLAPGAVVGWPLILLILLTGDKA